MARVIFIVGLPGSGKTHLANQLLQEYGKNWCMMDDPKSDDDRELLFVHMAKGLNLIITDPMLCLEENRDAAEFVLKNAGYKVEWKFFENNPEKCRKNIEYRNDGRSIGHFDAFQYQLPKDQETITIWQPENNG